MYWLHACNNFKAVFLAQTVSLEGYFVWITRQKPQLQQISHQICNFEFAQQVGYDQSILRTTWLGSLSTWRLLLPAEVALLQEELVAVTTKWCQETPLTGRVVLRFVPRLFPATVPQRFLYMEKKGTATKNGMTVGAFYNYACNHRANTGTLSWHTKLSWTTVILISASVALESSICNGSITGRLNHCSGET